MFAAKDLQLTRPSGGAYIISRSLRFRSSASAYLNRTFGTPTDGKKWTWSCWLKLGAITGVNTVFGATSGTATGFIFSNSFIQFAYGGNTRRTSSAVYRDPSAWYHIVFNFDSAQASETNRAALYVNGVLQTWPTGTAITQNDTTAWNANAQVSYIANALGGLGASNLDGYLADTYFIDGQALSPTSFGAINATTGVWSPLKYTGTYGTNGFHLDFNSYGSTAALGTDTSGNGNTWTVNNCSVTAGVTYDSMIDVPTVGTTGSNYCVLSAVQCPAFNGTLSDGGLTVVTGVAGNMQGIIGTFALPTTGKWYWEAKMTAGSAAAVGIADINVSLAIKNVLYYGGTGTKYVDTSSSAYGASYTAGDVIGVAVDMGGNTVTFYKNNASQGVISYTPSVTMFPIFDDLSGAATATYGVNFGQQGFTYTPPSGYSALNTYNLSTPSILIGAAHMAATTYTGTGASQTIANTVNSSNFQPDFVWMKGRSGATDHALYDSVRGTTKDIASNTNAAETTETTGLTAFGSTGFTIGALAKINTNAATYVGWQWKGSGTTVSNTTGSITSTVCVNPTAGFSIAGYTGTGANGTVGHGLGIALSFLITKRRTTAGADSLVWHSALANTEALILNSTSAKVSGANIFNSTSPTSSVFSIGTNGSINTVGDTFIAYCFAPIAGYSAFGSYTGNGSADGPFIYCGFRPRWIMVKMTSSTSHWVIVDTSRSTYNETTVGLEPDAASAETTGIGNYDILSNGFKCRNVVANESNVAAGTYIYAAFAESPFKNSLAR